jgi:hypothetical protein
VKNAGDAGEGAETPDKSGDSQDEGDGEAAAD